MTGLFIGDLKSAFAALVSVVLSVVLSTIVIVAFARKKDAQPFMSVEDFYGGLFVGFLVGYNGDSWVHFVVDGNPAGQPARVNIVVASVMQPTAVYFRRPRPSRRPSRVPG